MNAYEIYAHWGDRSSRLDTDEEGVNVAVGLLEHFSGEVSEQFQAVRVPEVQPP